jgi:hypothetical protein
MTDELLRTVCGIHPEVRVTILPTKWDKYADAEHHYEGLMTPLDLERRGLWLRACCDRVAHRQLEGS